MKIYIFIFICNINNNHTSWHKLIKNEEFFEIIKKSMIHLQMTLEKKTSVRFPASLTKASIDKMAGKNL